MRENGVAEDKSSWEAGIWLLVRKVYCIGIVVGGNVVLCDFFWDRKFTSHMGFANPAKPTSLLYLSFHNVKPT